MECAVTFFPSSRDLNATLLLTSHLCGNFCRAPGFWAWRGEHVPHGSAGFCHSSHLCLIVSSGAFTDMFFHSYLLQRILILATNLFTYNQPYLICALHFLHSILFSFLECEAVITLKSGPKHPSYKILFFLGDLKELNIFVLSREMVMGLEVQEHTYIYFHSCCCWICIE